MKIRKAVLPVAGVGTRFMPATKVVPKELLPIVDKPVIQFIVEEAVRSGIEEIIFVISKGKELIKEHFSHQPKIEEFLLKKGKTATLDKIKSIHKMAKFTYVYQDHPHGDGHAILCAEKEIGNEPFLVLFGDDIIKNDVPAEKQLIDNYRGDPIIAIETVAKKDVHLYGIIKPGAHKGDLYEVKSMVEKPSPAEAPSRLGIIGKFACPPEVLTALKNTKGGKDGEIRLVDALSDMLKTRKVWALRMKGKRFDTGKPEGMVAANNAFLN
jgi:UTP--glucose-1-phosphate uridylyltransferase